MKALIKTVKWRRGNHVYIYIPEFVNNIGSDRECKEEDLKCFAKRITPQQTHAQVLFIKAIRERNYFLIFFRWENREIFRC